MDVIFTYQGLCLKSNHCRTKRSSSENKVRRATNGKTARWSSCGKVELLITDKGEGKRKEQNQLKQKTPNPNWQKLFHNSRCFSALQKLFCLSLCLVLNGIGLLSDLLMFSNFVPSWSCCQQHPKTTTVITLCLFWRGWGAGIFKEKKSEKK